MRLPVLAIALVVSAPIAAEAGRGGSFGGSSGGGRASSSSSSSSSGSRSSGSSSSSSSGSRSSGSSSYSGGSSGSRSSSGSSSSSGSGAYRGGSSGSRSHDSSSSSSSASRGTGGHGGGRGDSWGQYGGTVRDHRGDKGDSFGKYGGTVRDHRGSGGSGGGGGGGSGDGYVTDPDGSSGIGYYSNTYDVVGYRDNQTSFGSWGRTQELPPMTFELGMRQRRFADPVGAMSTLAGDGGYTVVGGGGADNATASQFRFLVGLRGPMYLGIEGELGGLVSAPSIRATSERLPTMDVRSVALLGGYGVVGARARSGRASYGVELAGGARSLIYAFKGHGTEWSSSVTTAVVEPRARAEFWISPFVTVGAQVGANVAERGDWNAGAFFAFHTRGYDGL